MAIAFVNGATGGNASAETSQSVTYSPTAGNTVLVFITTSATTTGMACVDSNNNPLAAGPTINPTFSLASFYYTAGSGITSFTCSWTTASACNMVVVEYSGAVGGVNPSLASNTASGTSVSASITVTTQDANDWIVGGMAASAQTITVTVGNSRKAVATAVARLTVADNTVAAAGAVSLTGTLTSAAWEIVVLELRTVIPASAGLTSNWLGKAVATGVNKH